LIPDPGDLSKMTDTGTSASGIAVDDQGNIYAGMPADDIHMSIVALTHEGIGTVRTCPAFPFTSGG
jgi:hypothetical protein